MNLFMDIETTGLPTKGHNWDTNYMDYPYIVSIAWKFKDKMNYHIIYQEGRVIPIEATKIHGITTKMGNDKSKTTTLEDVYKLFVKDAVLSTNVIGHNIYFDTSIVKAGILRKFGAKSKEAKLIDALLDKDKRMDTMRSAQKFMGGKWPKLTELHERLFNKPFPAHNAAEDVLATERCFYEMRKRKIL
jgi:DNA polymerase-3 subunit alpha